ncbi:MAG: response regulator [Candidatus Eisenbacteria bacterium]|nr:response regulator [Candidatus Eisenbacteria bacterium]
MKPRVLIVDDEKNIRRTLSMVLSGDGYAVREAPAAEEALQILREAPADVILLDIGLPGMSGLEALETLRSDFPHTAVIIISGQASIAEAVKATRLGAFDVLEKPLSRERILIAARNALKVSSLGEEVDRYKAREARRRRMVGESRAMQELRDTIHRVGPTNATVLITGESGTGKELVARHLHEAGSDPEAPFVMVNCAAIPEELIETELFGCVRGAYTGADRARDGKFQQADGGTLFLDEVGDMSLRVQAKVLRALQEREIERVGDSKTLRVDVRVVAATNKDLSQEAAGGTFREDLLFRLNVVPLHVPPLRERREDIPVLAQHFLEAYAAENGWPPRRFTPEAMRNLERRTWRGNIRELANVVERVAILSRENQIAEVDLERCAPGAGTGAEHDEAGLVPRLEAIRALGGLVAARREFERRCIQTCLEQTQGNISQAAQLLGIERSNLHKKIQALGLETRPGESSGGDQGGV